MSIPTISRSAGTARTHRPTRRRHFAHAAKPTVHPAPTTTRAAAPDASPAADPPSSDPRPHGSRRLVRRKLVSTLLVVWVLITVISALTTPLLAALPLPVRTFAVAAVMVPVMLQLVLPGLQRLLGRWLTDPQVSLLSALRPEPRP